MIVVADASPLIFLGKLRRLDLISATVRGALLIPESVRRELLPHTLDPAEKEYLEAFLKGCAIETVRQPRRFASSMSAADNDGLTLAIRCRADWLLCDDRITRLAAETEGVRTLGTLGILLRALRGKVLTPAAATELLDRLVRSHGLRISIELYQQTLSEIAK
ncbi:MAG: DUF3368 domain-containing protein [bacterium]